MSGRQPERPTKRGPIEGPGIKDEPSQATCVSRMQVDWYVSVLRHAGRASPAPGRTKFSIGLFPVPLLMLTTGRLGNSGVRSHIRNPYSS
jgi:hypothetical protein